MIQYVDLRQGRIVNRQTKTFSNHSALTLPLNSGALRRLDHLNLSTLPKGPGRGYLARFQSPPSSDGTTREFTRCNWILASYFPDDTGACFLEKCSTFAARLDI